MKNVFIKKCLNGLALLVLCLSSVNAAKLSKTPIPDFTAFDLDASVSGYIVQGTVYLPGGATTPGTMVVDSPNQRIAFLFGGVGNFITDSSGSYNWNLPGTGTTCYKYPEYTYDVIKSSYAEITAAPGSTSKLARYTGYTKDSASCNQRMSYTFIQGPVKVEKNKIPVILEFDNGLPTPIQGTCVQGQAYWVSDLSTLDTQSNRDSYFVKPDTCNTPTDYCSTFYPVGNACVTTS